MVACLRSGVKIHGTRVVGRIINLTDIDLTFYDQFGNLVTLHPEQLKLQHDGKLPIIGNNTFIAIDESVDEELLSKIKADDDYKDRVVIPQPIGKIHGHKEGYHLIATGRSGRFFVTTSNNPPRF